MDYNLFHKNGICGFVWYNKKIRQREYIEVDSEITVTSNEVIITPSPKKIDPISIPMNKIVHIKKEKGDYDVGNYHCNFITWIYLKDSSAYKIFFNGNRVSKLNETFFTAMKQPLERIKQESQRKKDELKQKEKELKITGFRTEIISYLSSYEKASYEEIAAYFKLDIYTVKNELRELIFNQKIQGKLTPHAIIMEGGLNQVTSFKQAGKQAFNIKVEGNSQENLLRSLNCPKCHAPLVNFPPCKCEYCGVYVYSHDKTNLKQIIRDLGSDNSENSPLLKEVYNEVKGISSKIDEIGGKLEELTVNMDANQLLTYLEKEKKNPDKIIKKVLENMQKHNFDQMQVMGFLVRLNVAIEKHTNWGRAFEKSWKEKIINYLRTGADTILSSILGTPFSVPISRAIDKIIDNIESR